MENNSLTGLRLKNFTAFSELELEFCPGVNVFIGANSTGKTHILKLLYAACDVTVTRKSLFEKLYRVFLPSVHHGISSTRQDMARLIRHGNWKAQTEVRSAERKLGMEIVYGPDELPLFGDTGNPEWSQTTLEAVFVPAKEFLANAPGFLALWEKREIYFDEIYPDILRRAYLPVLRTEQLGEGVPELLETIKTMINGEVTLKGQEFFFRQTDWDLEFVLLAEGYRKLGLLWLLIRNGSIAKDSILFWDEPEANLNPRIMRGVIHVLLKLQRLGVQVFLATHDYVVLRELDLQKEDSDQVRYFSLFRDQSSGEIVCNSADELDAVDPNLILDTFVDLYDRDVERALKVGSRP
jgi:hypothetical protein